MTNKPRPDRNQFIDTIRNGDDSEDKNVILNFDAIFEIIYNYIPDDIKNYVGRSETLDAGNDYVGIEAAKDDEYINRMYCMFLEAWIKYKKTDKRGQYLESAPSGRDYLELEKIIDTL